jgi:hypothetical protein
MQRVFMAEEKHRFAAELRLSNAPGSINIGIARRRRENLEASGSKESMQPFGVMV